MNPRNSTGIQTEGIAGLPRAPGYWPPRVTWLRLGIVAVLLCLVYAGPIRTILNRWLADANWSHGWLIPLFSLYFVGLRRRELVRIVCRPAYVGALLLALSLAVFLISAWWLRLAYPQALSIVGAILGVTLLMGGWDVVRMVWFPIVFLTLAIPLPHSIYVELTLPLRAFASTVAAAVMPFFASGLHTEAQSVVIDYVMPGRPPQTLNVEEACSGMRLTMSFVTLGFVMAHLGERPWWHRVALVLSCIPIAVACNVVRVTATGLMIVHGHPDWARGTPHQLLGITMLLLALALLAGGRYVLGHLYIEEESAAMPSRSGRTAAAVPHGAGDGHDKGGPQ